jgi:hypothetical protein
MTMHQKVNVFIILKYAKKGNFEKNEKMKKSFFMFLLSSIIFVFSSLYYFIIFQFFELYFSIMAPCLVLQKHLFCLSHRKTHWTMLVDKVSLEYIFWGLELHGHFDKFFLDVNRSGPMISSRDNYNFYMSLGRLHGP